MTYNIDDGKPSTPAEALEHHGVKGQKWGVIRANRAQAQADRLASYRGGKFANSRKTQKAQNRAQHLAKKAGGVKKPVEPHARVKANLQKRITTANKIGYGKTTRTQRAGYAVRNLSTDSISRSGTVRGAARVKSRELQGRLDRYNKGKQTVRDVLAVHGGDRLYETSGRKFAGR